MFSCSVSTTKGLWEEHVAKLRGKEVNEEAVIGGRVCRIDEAEEPSDVLWENIDTSIFQRCGRRLGLIGQCFCCRVVARYCCTPTECGIGLTKYKHRCIHTDRRKLRSAAIAVSWITVTVRRC